MAEIYRGSTNKGVALSVAGASPTKCVMTRNGEVFVDDTSGNSAVLIPYGITRFDGPFEVTWTYDVDSESYVLKEEHHVVTPIFTETEFSAFGLEETDGKTYERLERTARYTIESYTGQSFGYREGIAVLRGMGSYMNSHERVIEVTGIDGYNHGWSIANSGFGIYSRNIPMWDPDLNVPIRFPHKYYENAYDSYTFATANGFPRNRLFTVTGRFGWLSVPEDVKMAGLLIAEELLCNQSLWRDRYVRAIRAADWRFDFFGQSMTGTGSLHADQLLEKYVRNTMVIV